MDTETQTNEKELSNRVWCCAWGLITPESGSGDVSQSSSDTSCSSRGAFNSSDYDDDAVSHSSAEEEEEAPLPVDNKPKEFVVTGGVEPQLKIIHISRNKKNVFPHEYCHQLPGLGVHNLAVSPDSNLIGAVSMDGSLMLLDVNKGVRLPNVSHTLVSNYWSVTFAEGNNDSLYAGTGGGQIYKYDTSCGKLQTCYDTQRSENVLGLAVAQHERLVGCCDFAGNFSLIDGCTGQLIRRRNFKQTLRKVAFDPSQRSAYVACDDKTVKLMDLSTGRYCDRLLGHSAFVMSVSVSPDGQRLVSGACDGSIKVWDLRTTKSALGFVCKNNTNLWDVAFNRLSNKIAFVGDGKGLNIYYCLGNREIMLV